MRVQVKRGCGKGKERRHHDPETDAFALGCRRKAGLAYFRAAQAIAIVNLAKLQPVAVNKAHHHQQHGKCHAILRRLRNQ